MPTACLARGCRFNGRSTNVPCMFSRWPTMQPTRFKRGSLAPREQR
jgi:hypothetical protein